MGLTTAELVSIAIALIEHAPEFIRFVQDLKLKARPLVKVPEEHLRAVHAALTAINSPASVNAVVQAVADQMGHR
jgi:hypothetical protein